MIKSTISHKYLRTVMAEMLEQLEDTSDEIFKRFEAELKHSSLIIPGDVHGDSIEIATADIEDERFGLLFTDMDEFTKVFADYEVESHIHPFDVYLDMLKKSKLDGFIINIQTECFFLPACGFEENESLPLNDYPTNDSYTSHELKEIKNQINNDSLEEFIQNPNNIARYEELFEKMSQSTLLILRLAKEDLSDKAADGMISMKKTEPVGFLHSDNIGGNYATVFTSEEKMENIKTPLNKYFQIVNFSQMTYFVLSGDMDGIIINPESDNIVLTREILLEFSELLEKTCNNHKLNSSIYHMFLMEV